MRRFILLLTVFAFLLLANVARAQQLTLEGTVTDAVTGAPIAYVNVTAGLASAETYRIESFAVSDDEGRFRLTFKQTERYILRISYLGFQTLTDTLDTAAPPENLTFALQPAVNDLSTIEVKYKLPIKVSGDTISYAADAFADGDERKLEDLLKKLPGFAVDDDGQVSVNGKRVENLKVDGKDFFGGNTKLATRSLPANAVDRVDVLRNYANDENMGKFGNGDGTALNIRLRDDKKNLVFGEIYGGYGLENAHDAGADLFYLGPTTSVNLIANRNDVGRQILSFRDMMRFNGGFTKDRGAGAIAFNAGQLNLGTDPELSASRTDELAALNLSHQPNDRLKASGTFLYGNNETGDLTQSLRTVLGRETETTVRQSDERRADGQSLTGLLRADYDLNQRTSIAYRMMASNGDSDESTITRILNGSGTINPVQLRAENQPSLRQQLRVNYLPSDRTLWMLRIDHQGQRSTSDFQVTTRSLPFGLGSANDIREKLDQKSDTETTTLNGELSYYRALNNTNQLNVYGGLREETSLFSSLLTGPGESQPVEFRADADRFRVLTPYLGLNHRLKAGKWTLAGGLRTDFSRWREQSSRPSTDGQRVFLLPQANAEYAIRKSSTLSLTYQQTVNWPGADRRTPTLQLRDLFSVTRGTNNLRESVDHQLSLSYYNYSLFNQATYLGGLTVSRTRRPLAQRIELRGTEQVVLTANAPGPNRSITAYGQVDKYGEYFRLSAGVNALSAMHRVNLGESEQVNFSSAANLNASIRSRWDKWPNFSLSGKFGYGSYRAGDAVANRFVTFEPRISVNGELFSRLRYSTDFQSRNYRQIGNGSVNVLPRWNARLAYETKSRRFRFEVSGRNLLDRQDFRKESFSNFLFTLRDQVVLGRRVVGKITYVI